MKGHSIISYDTFKPIFSVLEFCIMSVGGYGLFIWLGTFINYEVVKFVIAVLTGMAIGAANEFGKKTVFPFLSNSWRKTILPYVKEKISLWKKSKNS